MGFDMGPIPWNRIIEYAERAGLDDGIVPMFLQIIRELDQTYLKWQKDQRESRMRANREDEKKKAKP